MPYPTVVTTDAASADRVNVLRNVRPRFAVDDRPNGRLGESELSRQCALKDAAIAQSPNLDDIGLGDLGIVVLLAEVGMADSAALADHIQRVIGSSSEEQMVRTHARSDIAMVADLQLSRDRAVMQFPGKAMGKLTVFPSAEPAVPRTDTGTSPKPTAIRLVDVTPEENIFGIGRITALRMVALNPSSARGRRAAAATSAEGNGRLIAHRKLLTFVATPSAGETARGLSSVNYTRREGV